MSTAAELDFLGTVGALNDETRIRILHFLEAHGALCVCDLQASLGMIQSRLSRHLKILKEAGFVRVDRKGTWAYYSIRTPLDRSRRDTPPGAGAAAAAKTLRHRKRLPPGLTVRDRDAVAAPAF